jgi:uncharacterized protein (TIGR00645 family)
VIEAALERFLSAARWLLAPFFVALALSLILLLVKLGQMVAEFAPHMWDASEQAVLLWVLGVIDLTLTAALVIIVVFSGYENFVAEIGAEHRSWPRWMAKIDFSGLKLRLMSTIVAIAAIQVLRLFVDVKNVADRELAWSAGLLGAFVGTALLLALADRLGGEKH